MSKFHAWWAVGRGMVTARRRVSGKVAESTYADDWESLQGFSDNTAA